MNFPDNMYLVLDCEVLEYKCGSDPAQAILLLDKPYTDDLGWCVIWHPLDPKHFQVVRVEWVDGGCVKVLIENIGARTGCPVSVHPRTILLPEFSVDMLHKLMCGKYDKKANELFSKYFGGASTVLPYVMNLLRPRQVASKRCTKDSAI